MMAFELIVWHPHRGAEPLSSLADYRIGAWLDDDACPVDAQVLDGCNELPTRRPMPARG